MSLALNVIGAGALNSGASRQGPQLVKAGGRVTAVESNFGLSGSASHKGDDNLYSQDNRSLVRACVQGNGKMPDAFGFVHGGVLTNVDAASVRHSISGADVMDDDLLTLGRVRGRSPERAKGRVESTLKHCLRLPLQVACRSDRLRSPLTGIVTYAAFKTLARATTCLPAVVGLIRLPLEKTSPRSRYSLIVDSSQ